MVRSGDVIPYIKSVTTAAEKPKMPLVPYIWNKSHVDVLLEKPAEDEGVQEKNITAFFTTIEVDGLGKGNVHKIYKSGKTTVAEIIKMTAADFEKIDGFKKKTADKLAEGIKNKIQQASLIDIMVASGKLGRGLGERKLKPILMAFPNILTDPAPTTEKEAKLKTIPGIGPENATAFSKNIPDFLAFLKECGLEDKLTEPKQGIKQGANEGPKEPEQPMVEGPFTGKKIVMTKVRDKDIISFVTNQGGFLEDTMKKDIFTLIVKSKEDSSNKTEYARANNIPIMTVEEFKAEYMK
jgi:NAD-dependent DNA ligase